MVAIYRTRLVIVVCKYRVCLKPRCKRRNRFAGTAMQHPESSAVLLQCRVNFGEALPDKIDTTVSLVLQRLQDVGVEYEYAHYLLRIS